MIAPRLETEHLVLRAHEAGDFERCAAMWADPATVRYIGNAPSTSQQTWSRMLGYAGLWRFCGYGYWAIEERASGTFAGDIGFADFRRDLVPSIAGVPEAGWVLVPALRGKGYASEALAAVLDWLDAHVAVPRSVCIVDPENAASLRVAERGGYREYARTDYRGPVVLLERLRSVAG